MTTHRIEASKVVIEDDRRKEQVDGDFNPPFGDRKRLHNYSQPHKIVTFPVEPQPFRHSTPVDSYWVLDDDAEDVIHETELEDTLLDKSPFHPDDTLILLEEWIHCAFNGYFLFSDITTGKLVGGSAPKPASTMPPELDSQCKQITLGQCLGVEERLPDNWDHKYSHAESDKEWYWIFLTKERER